MPVLAYDPYLSAAQIAARGAAKVELDDLLARADFVSINCPLTEETRGMIGAREFALMQPHAYFITSRRAATSTTRPRSPMRCGQADRGRRPRRVGEGAAAARSSAARLRQRAGEPAHRRRVQEARITMGRIAAEQMLDALDGKRPPRIVNPEVWPLYARRFERAFGFVPGGCEGGDVTYLLSCHPGRARSARAGTDDPQCRDSWIPDRLASLAVRDDNGSGITD